MSASHSSPTHANRTGLRLAPDPSPSPTAAWLRELIDSDGLGSSGLRELAEMCGGVEALAALSGPTEVSPGAVSLDGVGAALGAIVDDCIPAFVDDEYRSIIKRLIRTATRCTAQPLAGRTKPARLAAAITWIAFAGNMAVGRRARWHATDIWFWFGVGDCAALGRSIARDLGMSRPEDPFTSPFPSGDILLADLSLLHTKTRAYVVRQRELYVTMIGDDERRRRESRPMIKVGNGQVRVRAQPQQVLGAFRHAVEGRDHVFVTFGENAADPDEVIVLTIPDARLLQQHLGGALDLRLARPEP